MTNPSKAWALMNPRSLDLNGRGGFGSLNGTDIALALKGLPRGPFLMGMAKECGDMHVISQLERCLFATSSDWIAMPTKLDAIRVRRLSGLAVFETLIDLPAACKVCRGMGYVVHEGNGVACERCNGTGGRSLSIEERAGLTRFGVSDWRSRWERIYEPMFTLASGWYSEAKRHLSDALSDPEEMEPA